MGVVSKLLQIAESQPGLHYFNPSVPHACSIPGGLCIGSKIYIHGMVPENSTGFSINLQRGSDAQHADLHLQLRAQLGGPPVLVWNSRARGLWGVEEQLPGPFPIPLPSRPFLLVISAYMDTYEVEVIGSANFSIQVRDGLPVSAVTHLAIEAQLTLRAVHATVESMPRNLRLSLGNEAKVGDMVIIQGQPTQDAKSFIVNWQSGPGKFDDVLFHLDSRIEDNKVVRNSRLDEQMGKEESSGECPFQKDVPFRMVVGVTSLAFETQVDGKELLSFAHRQDIATAKTLFLEGDLQVQDISIDCAQLNPPGMPNGVNIKSRGIRLQLICPEVPLNSRVTGGFEKGCFLLVSGKVNTSPTRFQLTLQCGEGPEDCDIPLSYIVHFEEPSPKVILNSKENNELGKERKISVDNHNDHLYAGCSFDLLIARTDEGFRCFLDGIEHQGLEFRLDGDSKPDHVTLCGDIEVRRLMVL